MGSLLDKVKFLLDLSIAKSLTRASVGYSLFAAIKDGNVVDLGYSPPNEIKLEQTEYAGTYALLIRRFNGDVEVKLLEKGSDMSDAHAQAIDLCENNRNEVSQVHVGRGVNATLGGRPVFQFTTTYTYMSKSESEAAGGERVIFKDFDEFVRLEKVAEVQSIIFPKDKYSVSEARSWLESHKKHAGKVDTTENFHRFRQFDPSECATEPRTISFGGSGIKAIICNKSSSSKKEEKLEDIMDDDIEKRAIGTAEANDLPDSAFAYIEPGGEKDEGGKTKPRSKRHFPIHDAAHVRNALARANQSPFGSKAMPKILAAAKKFGIKVSEKKEDVSLEVEIKKADLAEGLVYGIVYEPDTVDAHGDWTSVEEIRRAAHNFLPNAAMNVDHRGDLEKQDVVVVESYCAPVDFSFEKGGELVKKGSWVLVSKIFNEELKRSISEGERTGYSLEGSALKIGE